MTAAVVCATTRRLSENRLLLEERESNQQETVRSRAMRLLLPRVGGVHQEVLCRSLSPVCLYGSRVEHNTQYFVPYGFTGITRLFQWKRLDAFYVAVLLYDPRYVLHLFNPRSLDSTSCGVDHLRQF